MSRPVSHTSEQLLQRTREKILAVLAAIFLVFLVMCLWVYPPASLSVFYGPLWMGGGLAALTLTLGYWGIFRFRLINILLSVGITGVLLYGAYVVLLHSASPSSYLTWLLLGCLIIFVVGGATIGSIFGLLLGAGLFALTITYPPSADLVLPWMTGMVGMVGIGSVSYLLMRFIEDNILLHAQTNDQLKAARLDALTGIYGRAATEAELRRSIEHAQKSNTPLSILVTDIDHFKQVNDQHGHATGDDVLRSFAKRLRRNVGGSGGIVGRWGGEEFLVILPSMARPDAFAMAERLRHEVSVAPVAGIPITASFGLASLRRSEDNIDQLFARADERLYEAKNAGRNLVR
ncbi:GGDEF domain-containing protein [Deinococcus xinjiangensis]|uniref:GGDEF domain-containing protein n=1 Tax=Deinococcus xinjiangensis TaxID=457454 RepID=UPI0033655C41